MEFEQVVHNRKSIRKFSPEEVPDQVIMNAIEHAVLAPNSSNMQTWDFYHVKTQDNKRDLVKACFSQSAARTAKELMVVTADPSKWKRSNPEIIKFTQEVNAPKPVTDYYEKLIPKTYTYGCFNIVALLKWILLNTISLFKLVPRYPIFKRDLQEVALKSAGLACENFVLSLTNQGFASCMMEGFDKKSVMKILKIKNPARVVMVIAIGKEGERGTWGPRFRLPIKEVFHQI